MMQYVVRSPEELVEAIDNCVDGARFKSRNQLINVVMAEWVARIIHPVDPYLAIYSAEDAENETINKREALTRKLLGEDWKKFKKQEERLAADEAERLAREHERYEVLKAKIRDELRDELRAELNEGLDKLRSELKGGIHAKTKKTRSR